MLEWLLTIGAAELGKAIFEQVLKLGQTAAEDYVKDFFKGCLKDGMVAAKPEVAKKAVAEALKAFLLLVTDELEDQELSKAEIRDRFDPALVQFLQNGSVKPILGKAFEKDCRSIDATALASLWHKSALKGQSFPALPEGFDWQRIGGEYLKKVRRIVRETPELRSLLETELLEDLVRNTTQLSPGFDVAKYRESLQCSYGHLKLYEIDSTDRVDAIKLWAMFIEQTVREALPPMRYDLPLDLKRQLQAEGQLEADLSPEALEHYRHEYFQQPARKVLEAIGHARSSPALLNKEGAGSQGGFRGIEAHAQRAVILGDPGSGKSSLLQYLALEWVEGNTEKLPLLIELREFAITPSANFLEFLHRGRGVDWQFDQHQLHQHLLEFPTLVMFDGLDEVFDRATQSTVIDDIIRFSQQYPKAQVLVTSRIIGYNPDRLQHANFRHFTIQPLSTDEIHEFIDRWYDLSMGSDPDKTRLKQRLKDAIANSKAIQNLADNPLLLTMMAILNRRQELPRDRSDLYDQASRVLLYHWDVDHKRLQLPMDAIGRREKQEMLRAIAYEMQAGEEGLKGNLISSDHLIRIVTDYLRDQGFSEPREKANLLIQQLRDRNFILCYRGADTYGFMHRTFLEYFCAMEIVHRFEKQRTLTFEQLQDEVFGQHWQDETWHEVLRLICGAIDPKFSQKVILYLLKKYEIHLLELERISDDENQSGEENQSNISDISFYFYRRILMQGFLALFTASDCFLEINRSLLKSLEVEEALFESLYRTIRCFSYHNWSSEKHDMFDNGIHFRVFDYTVLIWQKDSKIVPFLQHVISECPDTRMLPFAIKELLKIERNRLEIVSWIKENIKINKNSSVREELIIKILDLNSLNNHLDIFELLRCCIQSDRSWRVRCVAIQQILKVWAKTSDLTNLLINTILSDPFKKKFDRQVSPQFVAIQGLLEYYPTHPKTLELLHDRALNDPDEQLRQWAQEQLQQMENQGGASEWT
jgi:hypothetical protein